RRHARRDPATATTGGLRSARGVVAHSGDRLRGRRGSAGARGAAVAGAGRGTGGGARPARVAGRDGPGVAGTGRRGTGAARLVAGPGRGGAGTGGAAPGRRYQKESL